jgi:SPX domain protein involved in polyphosphate accumulation
VHCLRQLNGIGAASLLDVISQELDTINDSVVNLHTYTRLNVMAFRKMIAKHKKHCGAATGPFLQAKLEKVCIWIPYSFSSASRLAA